MGSKRLPGKAMKLIVGKPLLWHVIHRMSYSTGIDDLVIATSDLDEDDVIEEFCLRNNIKCYRGSSDDVVSRFYEAAQRHHGNVVVRLTADNPLIDPAIVDSTVRTFKRLNKEGTKDNFVESPFYPIGLNVEVLSFGTLRKIHLNSKVADEREHLDLYIYRNRNQFRTVKMKSESRFKKYRLTVDTNEDLKLVRMIFKSLYTGENIFYRRDIVSFLNKNPQLLRINQHVEQFVVDN